MTPRAIHIQDLQGLDTPELRKRLALALAAVRVASIEAGGIRSLESAIRRVQQDLAGAARLAVQDLSLALAEHEAKRAPPPPEPPPEPAPPPPPVRGARLPVSPQGHRHDRYHHDHRFRRRPARPPRRGPGGRGRDLARSLVDLGVLWALEADLDVEFAHDGIYWDAPDEREVVKADALAKKAKADLALLLTDAGIEAEYRAELQGQHYQALRAERTREPVGKTTSPSPFPSPPRLGAPPVTHLSLVPDSPGPPRPRPCRRPARIRVPVVRVRAARRPPRAVQGFPDRIPAPPAVAPISPRTRAI